MGFLVGLVLISLSVGGALLPLIALALPPRMCRSRLLLPATFLATAAVSIALTQLLQVEAYSAEAPKRVFVNHIIETQVTYPFFV
jgi:hypothetical protein